MNKTLPLNEIFCEYVKKRKSMRTKQNNIFVSVGSAANLSDKNILRLEDRDMHQFPSFVEAVFRMVGSVDIILIDPMLKDDPYLVTDYFPLHGIDSVIDKKYRNIFHTTNEATVYCFKNNVTYNEILNETGNGTDMVPILRKFNDFCIMNNDIFIFHDFTGRDTWKIAEFFDAELEEHINHILYDITMRSEGSCLINLENQLFSLPINISDEIVHFMNPYYYTCYEISVILSDGVEQPNNSQLKMVIANRMSAFKKRIFPLLRRLIYHRKSLSNVVYDKNNFFLNVRQNEFFHFDGILRTNLYNAYLSYVDAHQKNKKNWESLLTELIEGLKMIVTFYLTDLIFLNGDTRSSAEKIAKQLVNCAEDPSADIYKWVDNVTNSIIVKLSDLGIDIDKNLTISPYF